MEEEVSLRVEGTDKTVQLDVIINNFRFAGMAIVRADNSVDLTSLPGEDRWDEYALYNGHIIARIKEVLESTAKAAAGYTEGICQCWKTHFWLPLNCVNWLKSRGVFCACTLTREFAGNYYYYLDGSTHTFRDSSGEIEYWAPDSHWEDLYYCNSCGCYVRGDDYVGDCECCFCEREREGSPAPVGYIEAYTESHHHKPVLFGEYESESKFQGLGFELEVDTVDDDGLDNEDTAKDLCSSCGLEENEMRFAHDGSLNYGFECISQPHTVKAFWDNTPKWRKMLSYLSDCGYASHNPGTCGLHVHVSRTMFGDTEEEQDKAIAKVYVFFDENWDNLVKVSRRRDTDYCAKLQMCDDLRRKKLTKFNKWKEATKYKSSNHYCALNNGNTATFEYRLGRGTLNAWSFFSWIDLMLTITKNARRITVSKVNSNDLVSWLAGISESTARYIYKRGAFRRTILALFPNIEWETDLTDTN